MDCTLAIELMARRFVDDVTGSMEEAYGRGVWADQGIDVPLFMGNLLTQRIAQLQWITDALPSG